MKLLLFDIDGTLLLTHGVGRMAVEESLRRVLGETIPSDGISFSGKTDPQIFREILAHHGLSDAAGNGRFEALLEVYSETMHRLIRERGVEVLPGVHELLGRLRERPDVRLGLLTGNLEPMAYLKLNAGGLASHFSFGAFGSDSEDRNQLPAIALERAREATGRTFSGKDVVVIGDTERDIACSRVVGAVAVAVCTGRFRRNDLAPHKPDVLLDDLADGASFCRHVFGDA